MLVFHCYIPRWTLGVFCDWFLWSDKYCLLMSAQQCGSNRQIEHRISFKTLKLTGESAVLDQAPAFFLACWLCSHAASVYVLPNLLWVAMMTAAGVATRSGAMQLQLQTAKVSRGRAEKHAPDTASICRKRVCLCLFPCLPSLFPLPVDNTCGRQLAAWQGAFLRRLLEAKGRLRDPAEAFGGCCTPWQQSEAPDATTHMGDRGGGSWGKVFALVFV